MNLSKSDLRKSFRAKIADQDIRLAVGELEQQLESALKNEKGIWGAFAALTDEPPVRFHELKSNVKWVFPKVEEDHIQFYDASADQLIFSKWGIAEPNPQTHPAVDINSLNGVCVPGLAFDQRGFRLGRGKGYYDRALKNFKGKKIGIAYSWQIAEEIPHESFDVPMDAIVTEKNIIRMSSGDFKK